ncbi:MAG: hypothetical protein COW42_13910 [Deltaproteobacteria bacterium CG17_big_fil_post_rev_8_21_14_2_50_63_7]|nr:MAG: hypothetical protein COW42_13910 [Deltaproteobacteria bacterium CG17_big_fil_post_rev_8_21_14_2_50_63_7]
MSGYNLHVTVAVDATAEERVVDLDDLLGVTGQHYGEAVFDVVNEGSASAYFKHADDTVVSAIEVPAGMRRESLPYAYPGLPSFVALLGANCRLTASTRGRL